jgi:chemotaxis response regulator CheB
VRARGGRAIVERPHSAGFPALPTAALREDAATDVLDARDIVPLVVGVMAGRDADAPPRAAAGRLREGKG